MTASSAARRKSPLPVSLFWLACLSVLAAGIMPGCGGCGSEDDSAAKKDEKQDEEKEKKKKEKPKENFEVTSLRVQPYDANTPNQVKPGHWVAAHVAMKANNFHFNAELDTATVDRRGIPLPIEHTDARMTVTRPAALPKGQIKHFESIYYVPRRASGSNEKVFLQSRLRAAGSGSEVLAQSQPTVALPEYLYDFVVLASEPDRYAYLKRMNSIESPLADLVSMQRIRYFQVILPRPGGRVPLPAHPLAWTSIAYALWDDLNPNQLDPDQQQAMLDWLHWGGQLIVSGPRSLERLRGSFLESYLPAAHVQSRELNQTAFDQLNAAWSQPGGIASRRDADRILAAVRLKVQPGKPLLGIEMKSHPQAVELPGTGGLVMERRVGRGRIVVTAFPLNARNVVNWRNYDDFFNACLLRRPPRQFKRAQQGIDDLLQTTFVVRGRDRYDGFERDARLSTLVRYFSRDVGHADGDTASTGAEVYAQQDLELGGIDSEFDPATGMYSARPRKANSPTPPVNPETDDPHFGGYTAINQSGMAGWNDYNGCAWAARDSLREAAGITIPKADFVMRVLGVYLLVLVPLNWCLFKLIGRVEWAWVAAPVIAVAGAVAVVRFAQLDIGFARARTEVAVLEVHGGYQRAHLTRYEALYTSLSTAYDMELSEQSSLAQPFSINPTGETQLGRAIATVRFRHDADINLSGFQVASNSTGMLHAEQMFNLGGPLTLQGDAGQGWRVENASSLTLRDVGVLRRTGGGMLEIAWIGVLEKKSTAPLDFQPAGERTTPVEWDKSPVTSKPIDADSTEVSLWRLLKLATSQLHLARGEVRLLGWSDDPLKGVQFHPAASQLTSRTMVIAHLRQGEMPSPKPDTRSIWSTKEVPEDEPDEFQNADSQPPAEPDADKPAAPPGQQSEKEN